MGDKTIKKFNLILFLSYLTFTNCIIEIPLTSIKVKGVPKYSNFKLIESIPISDENKNNRNLIEEGNALIDMNLLFIANIKIGSNKQEFNMVLDTGSYIMWVAQQGSYDISQIVHHFNPSASSTCKNSNIPFEQAYGTGSCRGVYYSDNVNYVNNRDFSMFFGVATTTDFRAIGADGIIGLAHVYYDEGLSFIQMLKKGGVTSSTMFSLKFQNINMGVAGKFYLGKHDDFSKNNVGTCPLVNFSNGAEIYWGCQANSFGLRKNGGSEVRSNRQYNLVFDTGTNVLILPLEYLTDIQNNLGSFNCYPMMTEDQASYQLVCSNGGDLPNFFFDINGRTYTIPSQYIFYQVDQFYIPRILFSRMDYYIIGSPFFFTFHTLFDKESNQLHFYPQNGAYLQTANNFVELNMDEKNENLGNAHDTKTKYIIISGYILAGVAFFMSLAFLLYYLVKRRKNDKSEKALLSNTYDNELIQ